MKLWICPNQKYRYQIKQNYIGTDPNRIWHTAIACNAAVTFSNIRKAISRNTPGEKICGEIVNIQKYNLTN